MPLIEQKTGIASRHIAADGETSADLAVAAAKKLFDRYSIKPSDIDYILLCTRLPTILFPQRLSSSTSIGIPTSAWSSRLQSRVLGVCLRPFDGRRLDSKWSSQEDSFLTAETYSKYIDREDRSLRTIFGDAAAATLITAEDVPSLDGFQFGTDGSGADTLLVADGGMRPAGDAIRPRHRRRWKSRLLWMPSLDELYG